VFGFISHAPIPHHRAKPSIKHTKEHVKYYWYLEWASGSYSNSSRPGLHAIASVPNRFFMYCNIQEPSTGNVAYNSESWQWMLLCSVMRRKRWLQNAPKNPSTQSHWAVSFTIQLTVALRHIPGLLTYL
jgi:hypothetical protein